MKLPADVMVLRAHGHNPNRKCSKCGALVLHGEFYRQRYEGSTPVELICGLSVWH